MNKSAIVCKQKSDGIQYIKSCPGLKDIAIPIYSLETSRGYIFSGYIEIYDSYKLDEYENIMFTIKARTL